MWIESYLQTCKIKNTKCLGFGLRSCRFRQGCRFGQGCRLRQGWESVFSTPHPAPWCSWGETAGGSSTWVGDLDGLLAPGFSWILSWLLKEDQWMEVVCISSPLLLPLCLSSKKLKKKRKTQKGINTLGEQRSRNFFCLACLELTQGAGSMGQWPHPLPCSAGIPHGHQIVSLLLCIHAAFCYGHFLRTMHLEKLLFHSVRSAQDVAVGQF